MNSKLPFFNHSNNHNQENTLWHSSFGKKDTRKIRVQLGEALGLCRD
jgi:hypothetical protein